MHGSKIKIHQVPAQPDEFLSMYAWIYWTTAVKSVAPEHMLFYVHTQNVQKMSVVL